MGIDPPWTANPLRSGSRALVLGDGSWRRTRCPDRVRTRRSLVVLCSLLAALTSITSVLSASKASADHLVCRPHDEDPGWTPITEIAYEVFVEPGAGLESTLRLRSTLINESAADEDAVLTLALPRGAELVGLRVARGGRWSDDAATEIRAHADGQAPFGSVYARQRDAAAPGGLPMVEVVAYGVEGGATIQLEVEARVLPTLKGDRWALDLPRRARKDATLSNERRVLVRDTPRFWVDDTASGTPPVITTRANDVVTVSWPARGRKGASLSGRLETTRDGFGGGTFRLNLQLGEGAPLNPDHVVLLVDRSLSTDGALSSHLGVLMEHLSERLPRGTTFDALAFARGVDPLLDAPTAPGADGDTSFPRPSPARLDDAQARLRAERALLDLDRAQGTNLKEALVAAIDRLAASKSRDPLILVVTDGMFPMSVPPDEVAEAVTRALGSRTRPDFLFLVDDPLVHERGLDPNHPVAHFAARLAARVTTQRIGDLVGNVGVDLLAAPKVLGELDVRLAGGGTFLDPVPHGLVAGSIVLLEGRYDGQAPSRARIRGKIGKRSVGTNIDARRRSAVAPAFVASTADTDLATAIARGFLLPKWHRGHMAEEAKLGVARGAVGEYDREGRLDAAIFKRYLRQRVLPRARVCYAQALVRNQLQGGRVVFDYEIGKGEVMRSTLADHELGSPDAELLDCLAEAAWKLAPPKAAMDGQVYRVRYPLTLTPPEDGKAPTTPSEPDPFVELLVEKAAVLAR
jgi:hypothetical protein